MNILDKILSRCRRNENGCLIFESLNSKGYAQINYNGKTRRVTRIIKHLLYDFDLDSLLLVLHKNHICKSKACIEDDHLYIGDSYDNMRDRYDLRRARDAKIKPYCKKCGFPLEGDNLISRFRGTGRECKNCANRRERENYRRKKLISLPQK